jgi:hypothetical protein
MKVVAIVVESFGTDGIEKDCFAGRGRKKEGGRKEAESSERKQLVKREPQPTNQEENKYAVNPMARR